MLRQLSVSSQVAGNENDQIRIKEKESGECVTISLSIYIYSFRTFCLWLHRHCILYINTKN